MKPMCTELKGFPCYIGLPEFASTAGLVFVMLILMLVLSVCLFRLRRRVKKMEAWKCDIELQEQPDVHYASLQNLAGTQAREECPEPPSTHNTDYATVAELQERVEEEEGEGEASYPDYGADPRDIVLDPQEGVAAD